MSVTRPLKELWLGQAHCAWCWLTRPIDGLHRRKRAVSPKPRGFDDVEFIIGTSQSVGPVGVFCVSNHPSSRILRPGMPPTSSRPLPPAGVATAATSIRK